MNVIALILYKKKKINVLGSLFAKTSYEDNYSKAGYH